MGLSKEDFFKEVIDKLLLRIVNAFPALRLLACIEICNDDDNEEDG